MVILRSLGQWQQQQSRFIKNENLAQCTFTSIKSPKTEGHLEGPLAFMAEKFLRKKTAIFLLQLWEKANPALGMWRLCSALSGWVSRTQTSILHWNTHNLCFSIAFGRFFLSHWQVAARKRGRKERQDWTPSWLSVGPSVLQEELGEGNTTSSSTQQDASEWSQLFPQRTNVKEMKHA